MVCATHKLNKTLMLKSSCFPIEQEELIQSLSRRNEEETGLNLLALDGLICLSFTM
jgi:hypothetical protein